MTIPIADSRLRLRVEQDRLVLMPGFPRASVSVPLAHIDSWDYLYEVVGRRFVAFHLGDCTAYVQLPRLSPDAREALAGQLTTIIGQPADLRLLDDERDNSHWILVWEGIKTVGRYLRLFVNPLRPPTPPPARQQRRPPE